MTTLDPRALEAAARELFKSEKNTAMVEYPEWDSPKNIGKPLYIEDARAAVTAALPHLTADDLRSTPAGRALVAQGKSLGWDDAIGELRKGQGLHRALAGTLSTRKPNYEEAT